MLAKVRWYLRRATFRSYRYFKHPRRLKANPVMRWFARHFLDKQIWRPCQSSFAMGVAIGVFAAAQLIPGQSIIGILLAAVLRGNIPTVLALTWLSNPATFAPIGIAEKHFGDWLLSILGDPGFAEVADEQEKGLRKGLKYAQSMYLGGLIGGLIATPVAYSIAWFSWTGIAKLLSIPTRIPIVKRRIDAIKARQESAASSPTDAE
jgi:uncharacterized protein (DUF2062 family)